MNKSEAIEAVKLLQAIIELSDVSKMLSTFIKAFEENSILKADGHYYLHGSFNLGGTVSNRLSSSGPNLQQIPSNSAYAKQIKECFVAAKNRLMCGADFSSLEDRISALTTKDPNKLKVYTEFYDGHSLRAAYYFPNKMPDIIEQLKLVPSDNVYEIIQDNGSLIYAKGTDILQPSGKAVEELYNDTNS